METMAGMRRSCGCGKVTENDCGRELTLAGWVNTRRDHGGLIFIDLRDRSGIVQLVLSPQYGEEAFHKAEGVRSEYVLAIKGKVRERSADTVNPKMKTGKVEVVVSELRVLNKAKTPPFYVEDGIDVAVGHPREAVEALLTVNRLHCLKLQIPDRLQDAVTHEIHIVTPYFRPQICLIGVYALQCPVLYQLRSGPALTLCLQLLLPLCYSQTCLLR